MGAGLRRRGALANEPQHAIASRLPGFSFRRRKSRENTVFHCALQTGSPCLYVTTHRTSFTGGAIKICTFYTVLLLSSWKLYCPLRLSPDYYRGEEIAFFSKCVQKLVLLYFLLLLCQLALTTSLFVYLPFY